MARDRKRAKQRQRQRRGQQAPARVGAERRAERSPAPAPDALEEQVGAPDPLENSSAEVEIAEAAIAQPTVAAEPLDEDEFPSDGDVADDIVEEPPAEVRARRSEDGERAVQRARQPSGAQLPREGNRLLNFLAACWAELQRVQWPDRKAVWQATAVVLVFVVIAGGYLGLWDAVFSRLVNAIL